MPNNRRGEIIRFTRQALGNLEDCGGFLFRAQGLFREGVAEFVDKPEYDMSEALLKIEGYDLLLTECEHLAAAIEDFIKVL